MVSGVRAGSQQIKSEICHSCGEQRLKEEWKEEDGSGNAVSRSNQEFSDQIEGFLAREPA